MADLSKLTIEELESLKSGGLSALSVDALERLRGSAAPTGLEKISGMLGRNLEIPGSLAGAGAGALAGSAVMPGVGTVIGGIVGGALGAGGGSLASDAYQNNKLDFEDALDEVKTSIVFDTALLGAGKILRPIAKSIGTSTLDVIMSAVDKGKSLDPPSLANFDVTASAGSRESLKQTQRLLESGGGSLSAAQTNQASFIRATADEIGQIGLLSGRQSAQRIEANNNVLQNQVQSMIDGIDPSLPRDAGQLGDEIYTIVETGRKAAQTLFADGQNALLDQYGDKLVNPSPLRTMLKNFENRFVSEVGDLASSKTRKLLDDLDERLYEPGSLTPVKAVPVKTMFDIDRLISKNIDEAMPGNQFANSSTVRELSELRTQLREATEKTLTRTSPKLAAGYKKLKRGYSTAMGDLLPQINSSVVTAASRQDYSRLGSLLIKQQNTEKIAAMLRSVDSAYDQIKKANKGRAPKDRIQLPVSSPKAAKNMIRQSYVRELFKDMTDKSVDFKDFRTTAERLSRPEETRRLQTILGKEMYPQFRRLTNAIIESTADKNRGLFNLAIRSQEINAAGRVGEVVAQGGGLIAASTMSGLPMAAAVLTVPSVLARLATNKRAVNRLIMLDKEIKRRPNVTPEFIASNIAKAFDELDEEEKQALQGELSQ